MSPTSRLAAAGEWLEAHPIAYFLALVAAPVTAKVAVAALTGGGLREAVESGLVFGVVFAAVTLALRRYVGQ
ncbi:hypothetical protein [Halosimplex amylolyticum]|uniref:hypothetical protein n=1 Tax=Halosimplex amylolyticum TaxID=3396616 RepID=UPI003F55190A